MSAALSNSTADRDRPADYAVEPFGQRGVFAVLFPLLAKLSIVLAFAMAVMWFRSNSTRDGIAFLPPYHKITVESVWGRIRITDLKTSDPMQHTPLPYSRDFDPSTTFDAWHEGPMKELGVEMTQEPVDESMLVGSVFRMHYRTIVIVLLVMPIIYFVRQRARRQADPHARLDSSFSAAK